MRKFDDLRRTGRAACIVALVGMLLYQSASVALADLTIATDTSYSGTTLEVAPSGALQVTHPTNGPTLTLENDATSSGVDLVVVGALADEEGTLTVNSGSILQDTGLSGIYGAIGGTNVRRGGAYLGLNSGATGTATVSGDQSQWNSVIMYVGYRGTGSLSVLDGGLVHSSSALLGTFNGAQGEVSVSGEQSTFYAGDMIIGGYFTDVGGHGDMNVTDGGQVNGTSAILGYSSQSIGTAIVTGSNSNWNAGLLYVGNSGSAELTISDHGQVVSTQTTLGVQHASQGTATVTGEGSKWTTSSLTIGRLGSASLSIIDGGEVQSSIAYMSSNIGTSAVHVRGPASFWQNSGNIYVGGDATTPRGTAVLNVSFGGAVEVGQDLKIWSTGTLTGASGTIAGHVINQGLIAPGDSTNLVETYGVLDIQGSLNSTGTLAFDIAGLNNYDQLDITGAVSLDGLLQVGLVNGYLPTVGSTFNLLDFGSLSLGGNFAFDFEGPAGMVWDTSSFAADGTITVTAAPLAGDLNNNGFVGQDDLNAILSNWGQGVATGDWTLGDPSGDGFVGQDDLNVVLGGWGQGTAPVTPVPEPASLLLLSLAAIGIAASRKFMAR